jgi:hypothetical protein
MRRSPLRLLVVGLVAGLLIGNVLSAGASGTAVQTVAKKTKSGRCKKVKKKPKPVVTPAPVTGEPLKGLFRLAPGTYKNGAGAGGSYIRLVNPGGSLEKGPYFLNPSNSGGTYTLLSPGTDGGLLTTSYQEPPAKPFGPLGDSLANRIVKPQPFAGIRFSISTSEIDPQTKVKVPIPVITNTDGKLGGQIQAISAAWNNQTFNQGSPKPDGTSPGLTRPVSGIYDPATKAFTLEWSSRVVGGPFNGFTGKWHLQGTFEPRC